MIHRFTGLDDSPIPPITQTPAGLLVVSSSDGRQLSISKIDFDAGDMHALKLLLEEASKYRQPPQELRDRIETAFDNLVEQQIPLVERIIRSFYEG